MAQSTLAGAGTPVTKRTTVTATTGNSQATWAKLVLHDAGLPITQNNVHNMVRWMMGEEPANDWYHGNNPLNVGATTSNPGHSFPSLGAAATATAAVLKQSNMKGIYSALKSNANVTVFSAAVVASPWAAGHYGGTPSYFSRFRVPTYTPAPTAVGGPQTGTAGGAIPVTTLGKTANCVVNLPNPFPFTSGSWCILNKSQLKALKGGTAIVAGSLIGAIGVLAIVASGFGSSGAGKALGTLTGALPTPVRAPLTAVRSSRARRTAAQRAGERHASALATAATQRQATESRESRMRYQAATERQRNQRMFGERATARGPRARRQPGATTEGAHRRTREAVRS